MNIFSFMGEHLVLTFFLALVVGDVIVRTTAAIRGHFDATHCDNCSCDDDEDEECSASPSDQ